MAACPFAELSAAEGGITLVIPERRCFARELFEQWPVDNPEVAVIHAGRSTTRHLQGECRIGAEDARDYQTFRGDCAAACPQSPQQPQQQHQWEENRRQRHRRQPSGFTPRYEIGELLGQGAFGIVQICHARPGNVAETISGSSELREEALFGLDDTLTVMTVQEQNGEADSCAYCKSERHVKALRKQETAEGAGAAAAILRPRQKERSVTQQAARSAPFIPRSCSLDGPRPITERHVESFACKTVHKTRSMSEEAIRYEEGIEVPCNEDGSAEAQMQSLRVKALSNEIHVLRHLGPHRHIVAMKGVYDNAHRTRLLLELCDAGDLLTLLRKHQQRATRIEKRRGLWSPINRAAAAAVAVAAGASSKRQGLPEKLAADVFRQLVVAVRHCHRNHVIHRDIKLENVLLCHKQQQQEQLKQKPRDARPAGPYTVKLADFGLAMILPSNGFATGNVGTKLYKAPEVAKGQWYTSGADIWSLGVVLYVLLSGQYPQTDTETGAILDLAPESLFHDRVWSSVSSSAISLVAAMMAQDPSRRPTCKGVLQHPWLSPEPLLTIEKAFRKLIRAGSFRERRELR